MLVENDRLAGARRRYSRLRPCPGGGKLSEAIAEELMSLDWLGKTVRIQVTVRPEIEFVQSYLDRPLWDVEEVRAAIHERLTGLRREITSLGGRLQAMDVLGESLETIKATATEQADLIGDADMIEVAIELARAQNFYEITLASTAKVMSLSLLDFVT